MSFKLSYKVFCERLGPSTRVAAGTARISSSCMQVLQPIGILCFASNWNPLLASSRSGEIFEHDNWSVFAEALELTEAAVYPHPDWVRDCAHDSDDSPSPQCLGSMFALASELGFNVCSKCCHLAFLLILIIFFNVRPRLRAWVQCLLKMLPSCIFTDTNNGSDEKR